MLLSRFSAAGLASSTEKQNAYADFAQGQLDYALGNNPMTGEFRLPEGIPESSQYGTVPYIVGMHPNSPQNPHSAISTGASPEDISNLDTVPEHEAYVLYGAVVGGPDKNDQFWDLRSDWVQNEVALDYVAPVLTLVARAVVNGTADPAYTKLQVGSYEDRRPGGSPCDAAITAGCHGNWRTGKIVMGVIVGVISLVVVSLGAFWVWLVWRARERKL